MLTAPMVPYDARYPGFVSEATVATFNVRHGRGLDDRVDLKRTASAIRRTGAQLLCLQELDRFHPRSGAVDQPLELQRLTGLPVAFFPTVQSGEWEYGIALAGEGVEDAHDVQLPRVRDEEPRRAIVARWRGLSILGTHLAVDPRPNALQIEELARLTGPDNARTVVLGDLNARRKRLGPLVKAGLTVARPGGGTLEPWWTFRRIDHVLAGQAVALRGPRTVSGGASDHRPLAVSLRWSVEDVASVNYDA